VVDATNVEPSARRQLVARATFAGVPAIAIVFALPRDVVLARNAARPERVVDPAIVERHLDRVAAALQTIADEQFASVSILRSPTETEMAEIVRG
jgi:protein phosphatase